MGLAAQTLGGQRDTSSTPATSLSDLYKKRMGGQEPTTTEEPNRFKSILGSIGGGLLSTADAGAGLLRTGAIQAGSTIGEALGGKALYTPSEFKKSYKASVSSIWDKDKEKDKLSFSKLVTKNELPKWMQAPAFVADVAVDPFLAASLGGTALMGKAAKAAKTAKTVSDLNRFKPLVKTAQVLDRAAVSGLGIQAGIDIASGNTAEGLLELGLAGLGASGIKSENRFLKKVDDYEGYLKTKPKDIQSFETYKPKEKGLTKEQQTDESGAYGELAGGVNEGRGGARGLFDEVASWTKKNTGLNLLKERVTGTAKAMDGVTSDIDISKYVALSNLPKGVDRFKDRVLGKAKSLYKTDKGLIDEKDLKAYLASKGTLHRIDLPDMTAGKETTGKLMPRKFSREQVEESINTYREKIRAKSGDQGVKQADEMADYVIKVADENRAANPQDKTTQGLIPLVRQTESADYVSRGVSGKETKLGRAGWKYLDEFNPEEYADPMEILVLDKIKLETQNAKALSGENIIKKFAYVVDSADMKANRRTAYEQIKYYKKLLKDIKPIKAGAGKEATKINNEVTKLQATLKKKIDEIESLERALADGDDEYLKLREATDDYKKLGVLDNLTEGQHYAEEIKRLSVDELKAKYGTKSNPKLRIPSTDELKAEFDAYRKQPTDIPFSEHIKNKYGDFVLYLKNVGYSSPGSKFAAGVEGSSFKGKDGAFIKLKSVGDDSVELEIRTPTGTSTNKKTGKTRTTYEKETLGISKDEIVDFYNKHSMGDSNIDNVIKIIKDGKTPVAGKPEKLVKKPIDFNAWNKLKKEIDTAESSLTELKEVNIQTIDDVKTLESLIKGYDDKLLQARDIVKLNKKNLQPANTKIYQHYNPKGELEEWALPSRIVDELTPAEVKIEKITPSALKKAGLKISDLINKVFFAKTVGLSLPFWAKQVPYAVMIDLIANKNTVGGMTKKVAARIVDVLLPRGKKSIAGNLNMEDLYKFDDSVGGITNIYDDIAQYQKGDSKINKVINWGMSQMEKQDMAAKVRAYKVAKGDNFKSEAEALQALHDSVFFSGQHLTSYTSPALKASKRIAPFLNSTVTGMARMGERVMADPGTVMKNVGFLSTAMNGLYLGTKYGFENIESPIEGKTWSEIFEDEEKRYSENFTDKRLMIFLPVLHEVSERDPQDNVVKTRQAPLIITIPTPEIMMYVNMFNKGIRQRAGLSPVGYEADRSLPTEVLNTGAGFMHPLYGSVIGLTTNFNPQTGREIETLAMKGLDSGARYDDDTSGVSKAIGKITGASPAMLDFTMDQFLARPTMKAANRFTNIGYVPNVHGLGATGMPDLTDAPAIQATLKEDKTMSTNRFYKKENDVNTVLNAVASGTSISDAIIDIMRREAKSGNKDYKSYGNTVKDKVQSYYENRLISDTSARNEVKARHIAKLYSEDPVKAKKEWDNSSVNLKQEIFKILGHSIK